MSSSRDPLSRLWAHTTIEPSPSWTGLSTPCLVWNGTKQRHSQDARCGGYGKIRVDGQYVYIHRWSLEVLKLGRKIRKGSESDHACERHACWNPEHLSELRSSYNKSLIGMRRKMRQARAATA